MRDEVGRAGGVIEKKDTEFMANANKVLYCASTTSHLKNFHLPYIKWLSENGCEVTTLTDDGQFIPNAYKSLKAYFTKTLLNVKNIKAILTIGKLIVKGEYGVVITNTTLAGAVVRLAVMLIPRRKRPKTLHISHGFWYSRGGHIERILSLGIEKLCASVTDVFVTMNNECLELAKLQKLGKEVKFVHGMGVDVSKFIEAPVEHSGYKFVYVADFTPRKNQGELIAAFAAVAFELVDASLELAGTGTTIDMCKKLAAELGIADRVAFTGYVDDVPQLLAECDCAVSTSRYEGMPFNIMESMSAGLPIIASRIGGHTDLLGDADGVVLYDTPGDLQKALKMQYATGKRQVLYSRLPQYTLDSVISEWQGILETLVKGN
jgi:glycosyltransferase EpsD